MNWNEKRILILGGTGSFATNFIRFLLRQCQPRSIRIYSRDEHKQTEFLGAYGGIRGDGGSNNLRGFIGDIRDRNRLRMAMENIDVVVHAAALKQVQSCEYNALETIKTNIMGAVNVIECALEADVEKVIGISTDKAVAPLNLYGASKMCMERLFTNANSYRGSKRTKFSCTRYGNVADSRGTVVHIWRRNMDQGVPVRLTHPEATRFWITMEEANRFVMESIELMDEFCGGEIFVPVMERVRVSDIKQAVCGEDYPYEITGERIGDKRHEALILKEELRHTVFYKGKYVIYPEDPSWPYELPEETQNVDCNGGITSESGSEYLSKEAIRASLEGSQKVHSFRDSDLQQAAK